MPLLLHLYQAVHECLLHYVQNHQGKNSSLVILNVSRMLMNTLCSLAIQWNNVKDDFVCAKWKSRVSPFPFTPLLVAKRDNIWHCLLCGHFAYMTFCIGFSVMLLGRNAFITSYPFGRPHMKGAVTFTKLQIKSLFHRNVVSKRKHIYHAYQNYYHIVAVHYTLEEGTSQLAVAEC